MANIIGIPTTRVSDAFIRERMLAQVQADQLAIARIQAQLSSGHRFESPSENPVAAQRVAALKSLLQRKTQVASNLKTNQSYLGATDSAMSSIANLLTGARATALSVIGTTATDFQRSAAAQQIGQALSQIVDTGNQNFRGRYLFGGSDTLTPPFKATADGYVEYVGNEGHLRSYGDVNLLFDTNLNGSEAFGAISQQVRGVNLQPALTYDTRLADLRQGAGITRGSIAISDGHSTAVVDLSSAETIGDVAALIRAHPPAQRTLEVEVTQTGLVVKLNPNPGGGFNPALDNLAVNEVGGGATAAQLGILRPNGVGSGPLTGNALNPALQTTTALTDILGTRAMGFVHIQGRDNDIILDAKAHGGTTTEGVLLNGVTIEFVNDGTAGSETVDWDPGTPAGGGLPGTPGKVTVHMEAGKTTAEQAVAAINENLDVPFSARVDPTEWTRGGKGTIDILPALAQTGGGGGSDFDQTAGLQITSRDKSYTISFASAKTMEDMLNALNGAGAGMVAEINQAKGGIDLRCRTSGTDFMIGENGGVTAEQLGLRSFTGSMALNDLNFGRGVQLHSDQPGALATSTASFQVAWGAGSGLRFETDVAGYQGNAQVVFQANPALHKGEETAHYDPVARTLTFQIAPLESTAADIVTALAADPAASAAFSAVLDPPASTGTGLVAERTVTVATTGGKNDFEISVLDSLGNQTVAKVDLTGAVTIDDVCAKIEAALGGKIEARLAAFGNGIELINADPNGGAITVTRDPMSLAAIDLGLVPVGGDSSVSAAPAKASIQVAWGTDSGLLFAANAAGYQGNVEVIFQNNPAFHQGDETAHYDPAARTLTFQIAPLESTAADIVAALAADPAASAAFSVVLDPPGSTGTGLVAERSAMMTGGRPESLVGRDVRALETESVFNALLRLKQALETNDNAAAQRAIALLDQGFENMNFSRAALGARQQGVDLLIENVASEQIELETAKSEEYDADLAEVISNLVARQTAYEASLRAAGAISQLSLLDYL